MNYKSSVFYIVIVFLVLWLLQVCMYYGYLYYYNTVLDTVDPYTNWVAQKSKDLLNVLGFRALTYHPPSTSYVWIYLNDKYASIINEGCNGISVMTLYVAFIMAFAQKWKTTLLYLLVTLGIFIIVNIFRVSWLTYIYRFQPDFSKTAHDLFFPVIIYGYIVLVWVVWMKYFVLKNEKSES